MPDSHPTPVPNAPDKKPSTNAPPKIAETLAAPPAGKTGDPNATVGPPLPGPGKMVRFGAYRILKRLGKGGMGSVYLAEDTRLGRKVALKLCNRTSDPGWLERFQREARAAASLRHPNLCPVHESDVVNGVPYFTMALIDGPPLDQWVDGRGGLSPREAALLVRKLALAMQYAHERGVVHRDLKPSNVAVERGEPVIFDFGLALHGDKRLTVDGSVLGTPAYMAPEQVKGDVAAMGPACDVYSLGAILYEMLTGRPPFEGPSMAVLSQVMTATPQAPGTLRPGLDPRLEEICLRCLAKEPGDRWPAMADLAAALTDWVKSSAANGAAGKPVLPGRGAIQTRPAKEAAAAPADNLVSPETRTTRRPVRRPAKTGPSREKQALVGLGVILLAAAGVVVGLNLRPAAPPARHAAPAERTAPEAPPQAVPEPTPPAPAPLPPEPPPPVRQEQWTPAAPVEGYLHELDPANRMLAVVVPRSRPVHYLVDPAAEVRLSQPAAGRGGKAPSTKPSLADLQLDQFVTVYPFKAADGRQVVRKIEVKPVPPGYPPPPPHGPPPGGAPPGWPPPPGGQGPPPR